jgi:hypothetical protein
MHPSVSPSDCFTLEYIRLTPVTFGNGFSVVLVWAGFKFIVHNANKQLKSKRPLIITGVLRKIYTFNSCVHSKTFEY